MKIDYQQANQLRKDLQEYLNKSTEKCLNFLAKEKGCSSVKNYYEFARIILQAPTNRYRKDDNAQINKLANWLKQLYYDYTRPQFEGKDINLHDSHLTESVSRLGYDSPQSYFNDTPINEIALDTANFHPHLQGVYDGVYLSSNQKKIFFVTLLIGKDGIGQFKDVEKNYTGKFTLIRNNILRGDFDFEKEYNLYRFSLTLKTKVGEGTLKIDGLEGAYSGYSPSFTPMCGTILFRKVNEVDSLKYFEEKRSEGYLLRNYLFDSKNDSNSTKAYLDFFLGFASEHIKFPSVLFLQEAQLIPMFRSKNIVNWAGEYYNFRLRTNKQEVFANRLRIFLDGRVELLTVSESYNYRGRAIFYALENTLYIWLDRKVYKEGEDKKCSVCLMYKVKGEESIKAHKKWIFGFGIWVSENKRIRVGEEILMPLHSDFDGKKSRLINLENIYGLPENEKKICEYLVDTQVIAHDKAPDSEL